MEPSDRLPTLCSSTSISSIEDAKNCQHLQRQKPARAVCEVRSPIENDSVLSDAELPVVKRQRSSLSGPILIKAEDDGRHPKDHGLVVSVHEPHTGPREDLAGKKNTNSCHWSKDPFEIDARASSHYLGMHSNMCSARLSATSIAHNARAVINHARQLLQLVHVIGNSTLKTFEHDPVKDAKQHSLEFSLSTPFVGYAILTAVDILSAAGSVDTYEEIMTVMRQSLAILDKLSKTWVSAKGQSRLVRRRIEAMTESVDSKESRDKSAWKCGRPLENSFGLGYDVLHDSVDVKRTKLFEYLEIKVREDEILIIDA